MGHVGPAGVHATGQSGVSSGSVFSIFTGLFFNFISSPSSERLRLNPPKQGPRVPTSSVLRACLASPESVYQIFLHGKYTGLHFRVDQQDIPKAIPNSF